MFESGNQMSFSEWQEYLDKNNIPLKIKEQLFPKIRSYVSMVIQSVKRKINCNRRRFCFEILGFDFMIDNFQKIWLIEANVNPCIEQSSNFLTNLIPRMLDDAFKLTIDKIFPRPYTIEEPPCTHKINGYANKENLWEYLCTIGSFCPTVIGLSSKERVNTDEVVEKMDLSKSVAFGGGINREDSPSDRDHILRKSAEVPKTN